MAKTPLSTLILRSIYTLLWSDLVLSLFDPAVIGQTRAVDSFPGHYGFLLDPIHSMSSIFRFPIEAICQFFHWYTVVPGLAEGNNGYFPISTAAEFSQLVSNWFHIDIAKNAYDGGFVLSLFLASFTVKIASIILEHVYPYIYNFSWNIFVEHIYHGKRVKQLQDSLTSQKLQNEQLMSRNRSLTRETHELKDTVVTDELTKVYNRRFFLERMNLEYKQNKRLKGIMSVIMIDIDFFKRLNDTYGHLSGDEVLKRLSQILKEACPSNGFPCRFGGEEFALILPGINEEVAYQVASNISQQIQTEKFQAIDPNLKVTLSQGICTVYFAGQGSSEFEKPEDLLEQADQLLYKSKMEGRNRISVRRVV